MSSVSSINCIGCLNSHRKLQHISTAKEQECFLEIIRNIPMPVPDNHSLYLCWECTAELYRFSKFKEQVTYSYKLLNSLETGSVSEFKPHLRLKTQDLFNVDYKPDEGVDNYFEVVKVVNYEQYEDTDVKIEDDYHSNDDETPLIEICKKRKKKKMNGCSELKNDMLEYTEIELNTEELQDERSSLQNQEDYVNAMFRCERCIMSFPNADDLRDHVHMKHERHATLFKCKICECAFSSEVSYNYHMNRHTRRYQCTACSDRFTSKRSAVKHYNMAHCLGTEIDFDFEKSQDVSSKTLKETSEDQSGKAAGFPCEFCPKTFLWRTSLRKHLETHRIENGQKRRPYCEPCKLSFTTTSNLQKHVKTSSKHQIQLKLWKLKETGEGDAAEPQTPADIRSAVNRARERFACAQCGARYQWRGNLLRHLKSHQAKAAGSLVCEPCNRSFSSIATYRQHMTASKKHVTEDDFKFMCSQCGRRFATRTRLRDHVDWDHLKNYVHTCPTCQKVFKSHTSLYLHEQVVHRKQPEHLCDHCGKPFPNQAKLRSHVTALHSGAAAYRCGDCGARFAWHSCLSRHVRRAHRKRNDASQDANATRAHAPVDQHATHVHETQNAHATVNTLAAHAHATHTQ